MAPTDILPPGSRPAVRSPRALWKSGVAGLLASALILGAFNPCQAQQPDPEELGRIEGNGEPPDLTEGLVPVLGLLKLIHYQTGKPVLYPSIGIAGDQYFGTNSMVTILGNIDHLTLDLVRAILTENSYEIFEKTLPSGEEVTIVHHQQARVQKSLLPFETPIRSEGANLAEFGKEELLTLVMQLEHADTNTVITALRDLLNLQGRGTPGTVTMVNINSTNTLIIRSRRGMLEYIQRVIDVIDQQIPPFPQILEVVRVYEAEAEDLARLVTEILSLSTTGQPTQGRSTGRPRRTRQGGGTQQGGQLLETYTRLIADTRTQKIIIDSTDPDEVELVMSLVDELDNKVDFERYNTHVYRVKYLRAEDLADDISLLIDGTAGSGLSNRNRNRPRPTGNTANNQQNQGQQRTPTRIVPHEETNSLLIQADENEYKEIERILEGIDIKRRQVFLEAALVQVNDASALNYTLEYLAGTLDDRDARVAAMSAFGLTTVDVTQLGSGSSELDFTRAFLPDAPTTGLISAVSSDGQLPVLLRAIKNDSNSMVFATPFILADDNQENKIEVTTDIFFETTTLTGSNIAQGSQDDESAGVTLTLTPTISEEVVLLDLNLSVSQFAGGSSGGGNVPDRSSNDITSRVTLSDGEMFIIGGLARESETLAVSKIPLLGDLPLIGKLFQSRNSEMRRDNLYVLLTCRIIDDKEQLRDLTNQSTDRIRTFKDDVKIRAFSPKDLNNRRDWESKDEEPEE